MSNSETATDRMVHVTAPMKESFAAELTRIARKHGRSRSAEIRRALEAHVAAEQAAEAAEQEQAA